MQKKEKSGRQEEKGVNINFSNSRMKKFGEISAQKNMSPAKRLKLPINLLNRCYFIEREESKRKESRIKDKQDYATCSVYLPPAVHFHNIFVNKLFK